VSGDTRMRPADVREATRLTQELIRFDAKVRSLPGIANGRARDVLVQQIIDSQNRNRYIQTLRSKRDLSPKSADPTTGNFDTLKAAILAARAGDFDEACWLVFLYVHFGKHKRGGWQYASDVYGRLGGPGRWDWATVSGDVNGFRQWLDAHLTDIRDPRRPHGFGNHRKYESLDAWSANGTGAVVASYVAWVGPTASHHSLFAAAVHDAAGDPEVAFDLLYRSLAKVTRFGRTARFDYLAMLEKLELANVRAGKAYLVGATGPRIGACRLLGRPSGTAAELDALLAPLQMALGVSFDVLEDALCNWQKSPDVFKPFRG
jgi:hypothetical protein